MLRSKFAVVLRDVSRASCVLIAFVLAIPTDIAAQSPAASKSHAFYIDCSATSVGDGSQAHPWNSLASAQQHIFLPGDQIALARSTACSGSFAPQGSGTEESPIRLTAYGQGPRPRIVAPASARQALLLFNQSYWLVDSLDLSGGHTYGIFVSGDLGPLHHLYLKNLFVHDVYGGPMKNKDNGLVIVGPSSAAAVFNDVLIDGVDVADSNQWAGILVGGGNYAYAADAPLNRQIVVRNSTAHNVYGDGIILFRDESARIATSAAWETGMQPTLDVGTPNAIWTWTCTDCAVEDNEAYLTDSPGVDGGAYDIDWDNTRNVVQRNYAHDTQGYCVAVFAAGYTTTDSVVRDNLCVNNGMSPRLAALQGAIYLHTWNDGPIRNLQIEHNTIEWSPPVADAAAIVNDALVSGTPISFTHNWITSSAPRMYRSNAQMMPSENRYRLAGQPIFTLGEHRDVSLETLQASGSERDSSLSLAQPEASQAASLRIGATINLAFDASGLLTPEVRAQLLVLRNLAGQYGANRLPVVVQLANKFAGRLEVNALLDLNDIYPGALQFNHKPSATNVSGTIRLLSHDGALLHEWTGFQNAATLGGAVRAQLGPPQYAHMQKTPSRKTAPLN